MLKQYIEKNNIFYVVFILDRAYFSYDLIDTLIKKNLFFVIRIKNNAINIIVSPV